MLFLFVACKPVVAPDNYDELMSYLYQNFDEDEEYLEEGLAQLNLILEDQAAAITEGYRIDKLSLEAIQMIEERDTEPDLIGISKSVDFKYPVDDFAYANFAVHPREIFVNPNAQNEREYDGDPLCFVEQACEQLHYSAILERKLPLDINATIYFETDIRWVDTEHGPAFIQRRWLTDDTKINKDWIAINSGYSVAVTLPMENGNAKQIETVWGDVAVSDLPLPEDVAFVLATGALDKILRQFEEYLERDGEE